MTDHGYSAGEIKKVRCCILCHHKNNQNFQMLPLKYTQIPINIKSNMPRVVQPVWRSFQNGAKHL